MAKKNKLFDDDSEEEVSIKTENEYAKKYDNWREKEELYKLEQKYGSKNLQSGETGSSDSEDDSEPLEVSEEVEKQFLKTLSLLKTKDPRIYDPNFKFFDEKIEKEKEKKSEPKQLTFADSDDDDDDDNPNIFSIEKKAEISDDEEKSGNKENKDGKLKDYLIGKKEYVDEEVEKDLAPLRALWSDPKLNDGEAFLRDYILNKKYLEDGDTGAEEKLRDDEDLEEDEKRVEEQGKFERAYNFRFEEPDEEYLKRFPRTMNYIRPKDDKRSRKRTELRTRKEEEKRRKMEEIARLKALKLKEIREKIEKIKEVTGNQDLAFKEEDIDSDFDPEEHDKRMKRIFDEQYYGEADDQKPVFPDLDEELEIENWEKYTEPGEREAAPAEELHCEHDDFNMDADYDPKKAKENLLDELKKNMGKKRRNRKRKSKLAELLTEEKPKFVPHIDKTYSQFMEEYYKMDCEDVIGGDLPTRFKYREVVPNDYGLTIEEILLADDKELTQWVPLKKIVKYRPDNVEKGEVKVYSQKAADKKLKKKILPSLFKDLPEEPEVIVPTEQIQKKKKKKKNKEQNQASEIECDDQFNGDSMNTENSANNEEHIENGNTAEENVSIRSKKKKKNKQQNQISDIERDNQLNDDSIKIEDSAIENGDTAEQKVTRKKKKKNNGFVVENTADIAPSQSDQHVATKHKNEKDESDSKQKLKRKVENTEETQVPKKKRKKNKQKTNVPQENSGKPEKQVKSKLKQNKKHGQEKSNADPMSHLSDERLKAYGLNPKKYRSFLKYKKF